ncbi:MAG TPA: 2-phospho-L-lactate transferase [Thermoleophilaceae bacterium]|nr:2-phospho-L-lactate transferase [Thermoleophilaceae bacterium]
MRVALLSGGTGGAKLARGLLDEVGAENLTVIANTGDDTWAHGVHVSPDPDLVTYWLADAIDERGYGIRDDSWKVMDALAAAGRPTWFRLGDRDLAMCLIRSELLRVGERLTEAHAAVVEAMGVRARVLPMCDEPVPTQIGVGGRVLPFQEFMIVEQAGGPLESVAFEGVEQARPTAETLAALSEADAIVIGPSNPIVSIGPILALPGMREALIAASAPTVAVSPFVGGSVLKGPTGLFCEFAGVEARATGIAALYSDLIDGMVADEPVSGLPAVAIPTLMDSPASRRRLAASTLQFAASLSAG